MGRPTAVVLILGLATAPALARDYSLVGAWQLDNGATLNWMASNRKNDDARWEALRALYAGKVICKYTESAWSCESRGNPNRKGWERRGSYRLLPGNENYRVLDFKTVETAGSGEPPTEKHRLSLVRIGEQGFSVYRPERDQWEFFRRIAEPKPQPKPEKKAPPRGATAWDPVPK